MTTETLIDDEVEMTTCDNRGDEISLDRYDGHEGLCEGFVATTFICVECSNRTYTEDAHKTHSTMCESCGDFEG